MKEINRVERVLLALIALLTVSAVMLASVADSQGSKYERVTLKNKTWHCTGKQKHTQVDVQIKKAAQKLDAIHLDAGCTGSIRIAVDTDSGDGVKVHGGAHDLTVFGYISCTAKHGNVHQDGVQAMGGTDVTFKWIKVNCPTGNNGGLYVNGGRHNRSVPTRILCSHCALYEGNASINIGPNSKESGARFSTFRTNRTKASPRNCARIQAGALAPVNLSNTCLTPKS